MSRVDPSTENSSYFHAARSETKAMLAFEAKFVYLIK